MKTRINTSLIKLEVLLENNTYSEILEKLINYEDINSKLELDKRLLMFDFDDDDVEALQLIDTIELQQFYLGKNIETLKEAMAIKEKEVFFNTNDYFLTIGLN